MSLFAAAHSLYDVKEESDAAQRPVDDIALRAHLCCKYFLPEAGFGRVHWTLIRVPRFRHVSWDGPHLGANVVACEHGAL